MATAPPLTRILSDLHYRHPAGFVQDLSQIAPLLEGVDHVVFNGDSVEARFVAEREQGNRDAEELICFCKAAGAKATLLTGNHDPLITPTHHLELADGGMLITHGDILFHGLTPWSRETPLLQAAHSQALQQAGYPTELEPLLQAARQAALAVEHLGPLPHHQAQVKTLAGFVRQVWPPGRVLRMLESWWRLPSIANDFAQLHRPECRWIILGHTHRAGVWRRGERRVVNTGAFLPWAGMLMVDLQGDEVTVRSIREQAGEFHPGEIVSPL